MTPSTILLIATIGISIWGFQDRSVIEKNLLYPYLMQRDNKQWYRIISHAFIHADWGHLFFNMIALWSFGEYIVYVFSRFSNNGPLHFFAMYFLAIIFSSIADVIKEKNNPYYRSLGASGAVSAVIFSSIIFSPWNLIYVFFIPMPSIVFAGLYIWYSSYMIKKGGDNVNHGAHLYGALFGFFYPLIIEPKIFTSFIGKLLSPNFF